MFIKFEMIEYSRPRKNKKKTVMCFICDQCSLSFTRPHNLDFLKQKYTFCNNDCRKNANKPGGKIHSMNVSKTKENWQNQEIRERTIAALTKSLSKPDVKEKRSKAQKVAQNRYDVVQKRSASIKRSHNTPEYKAKASEIQKEAQNRPEIKEKKSKSIKEAWTPEAHQRRHETMKRNGTYGKKTKPEAKLETFLQSTFGIDNVIYQKFIHRWPIDFYVKSVDAYIQFDGVYWHGLDRTVEELALLKTKRDINIYSRRHTDSEQNAWFKTNNLKLVRITDKEVKRGDFSKLKEFLP